MESSPSISSSSSSSSDTDSDSSTSQDEKVLQGPPVVTAEVGENKFPSSMEMSFQDDSGDDNYDPDNCIHTGITRILCYFGPT